MDTAQKKTFLNGVLVHGNGLIFKCRICVSKGPRVTTRTLYFRCHMDRFYSSFSFSLKKITDF